LKEGKSEDLIRKKGNWTEEKTSGRKEKSSLLQLGRSGEN